MKKYLFIESYSIKSSGNDYGHRSHPLAWTLFGSTKSNEWKVLKEENVNEKQFDSLEIKNFSCSNGIFNRFKFSFSPHDINDEGKWVVALRQIDLFGYLIPKNYLKKFAMTPTRYNKHFNYFLIVILILSP